MKRITLVATIALAGAFGLVGCHGDGVKEGGAAAGGDAAFNAALADAKAEQKKAAKVGGEWRDIGKFLKEAEEAAKAGDMAKANKLVAKAKFQAMEGQKQAAAQVGVGNPDYLK